MKRLALDTNRYTDLAKGVPDVVAMTSTADVLVLPFVVIAELRAGFALGTRAAHNEQVLTDFLRRADVEMLWPDSKTTSIYAAVYRDLTHKGKLIPTNDIWIAAACLHHAIPLYTRDGHFAHVHGLSLA